MNMTHTSGPIYPIGRACRRAAAASAVLALTLAGCASSPTEGGAAVADNGDGARTDCIMNRGIRDFRTLDEANLILYGPGRQPYHVVLASPSLNLEREFSIGIYDRDGRICPYSGDAIIIEGPLNERIPISSIERIDEDQVEALLVEFGKIEAADEGEITVTEIQ